MRKAKRRKGFFAHLWELIIIELLIIIYVFVHNVAGMKRRQLSLLLQKEAKLRDEVSLLRMEREKLLSLPSLEEFAKRQGLKPIDPAKVQAIIKQGNVWVWRKK